MKRIFQTLLVLFTVMNVHAQSHPNTINAIVGDISYVQRFEKIPDNHANELLRLQTHLSYVEEALAAKDLSHLNDQQKQNRALVLQLLHQYWTNGIFPKNYDYEERRPCFIDRDGNICAVGYLIEETAGRNVAEAINKKHQYDYLLDMNEDVITEWADKFGLTLEECAMIQPAYQPFPPEETYNVPVKTSYGISSGFVGGFNIGVNLINIANRQTHALKTIACIGIISGTSQIVLGLANIKKDETEDMGNWGTRSYKAQNILSYANIAAGTTTVLTSAVNLWINARVKDKRNAFNLYSYPVADSKMVAGFAFTRSL